MIILKFSFQIVLVEQSICSQHAHALERLKNQLIPGEKALDVGSGSGYLTACMAIMLGENGRVVGIEHIPDLVTLATKNIKNDHPELLSSERIKLIGKIFCAKYSAYS